MNLQKMLKEMQKMQGQVVKAQKDLESQSYEAEAGGGAVKVVINGHGQMNSIRIAKEAVDPTDIEALEDLVMAAVNSAIKKKDEAAQASMGSITQGLQGKMPPGMGF